MKMSVPSFLFYCKETALNLLSNRESKVVFPVDSRFNRWMCYLIRLIVLVQDLRVYNEEAVLDNRSPEQDYEQYKDKCDLIAKLMGEIQELKASGAKEGVRTSTQSSVLLQAWFLSGFITCQGNPNVIQIQMQSFTSLHSQQNLRKDAGSAASILWL